MPSENLQTAFSKISDISADISTHKTARKKAIKSASILLPIDTTGKQHQNSTQQLSESVSKIPSNDTKPD
ncbi:hypothetical protein [Neisseria polysaccharea]|uniref:hypothetical protein n=1 Tax=Neisseria polysaccharea TaxID=489 RepID=UPI0027E1021C|nr:hypothetical protein [Neisseria polysaccharea]